MHKEKTLIMVYTIKSFRIL